MLTPFNAHLDIMIFLLVALVVVSVCKKIKISSVLGYLVAGVLVGPHTFNIVAGVETAKHVAEFGIVFLLFTIGLELSWERLRELRFYVFGLGAAQFFLTATVFGLIIFFIYHTSLPTAILLGGGLSLSSTAIVLQVLAERNELTTRTGRISFAVLLFQDIAVIFLLVWVTTLTSTTAPVLGSIGWAMMRGFLVLVSIALLGRFFLRPLYRMVASTRSSELFMATTLLVILMTALSTAAVGLSLELGGFLAGLLLAETEYRHQIEADLKPFRALLLGLFFITVGMSINPAIMMESWRLILGSAFLLLAVKIVILLGIVAAFRFPIKTGIKTALLMAGGGEFMFVLLAQASDQHVIAPEVLQIVNISVIFTMALTPFLASLGKIVGRRLPSPIGFAMRRAEQDSKFLKNHIIVVGYGRVGMYVQRLLAKNLIPHVALDMNMAQVTNGRDNERAPVFFGDARRPEIYRALGAERSRAILLTMNDFNTTFRALTVLKRYFPDTPVYARTMDKNQALKLKKAGGIPIMPESYVPSFQLVAAVLSLYNLSEAQIRQILQESRQEGFEEDDLFSQLPLELITQDIKTDKSSSSIIG